MSNPLLLDRRRVLALATGALSAAAFGRAYAQVAGAADLGAGASGAHGISTFGDLKYPSDFKHLDYVNVGAPKGGEISQWLPGGYDNFNPFTLEGRAAALATAPLESLLTGTSDEHGAAYCLLAQSFDYPASRDWVVFALRPEARFSDGSPVTPQDVVFSYEQFRDKGLSSFRLVIEQMVESAEALDGGRVKFTFKAGYPRRDVIQAVGGLNVFSKADFEARKIDLGKSLDAPFLGTGAYKLARNDQGRSVTWARDPNYWGTDFPINVGRNNFDQMRFEYFGDYQAAFEGFKAGEYRFRRESSSIIWATGYDFPALTAGHVVKEQLPDNNIPSGQCFVFNLRRAKFQDPRVREALGLMFNFEWSNESLFYGLYARVASFWQNSAMEAKGLPSAEERAILEPLLADLPEGILEAEAVLPPSSGARQLDRGNMRKAAALLEEAGWPTGADGMRRNAKGETLRVEILNDSQTFDRVINPYVENLRALGVDALMSRVDDAQYETRKSKHDFDMITTHLGQDPITGADLEQYFGAASVGDTFNAAGLANPAVDAIIKRVVAANSRAEMELSARVLDRVLRALRIWVPQWFGPTYNIAYYDMFEHPEQLAPYALGELDFWWYSAEKAEKLKAAGAL